MTHIDLTLELRSANGTSTEYFQSDEKSVRKTLTLLAAPRLFAQPHLLLASPQCASLIPCKGIDMILVRTLARTPLESPLNLPQGLFDIVEQSDAWPDHLSVAIDEQNRRAHPSSHRRNSQIEIHTLGGWKVTLKATATIHGNVHDERQWFGHLPEVPTIPFRLEEGGFGLINTANILRVSARPKPEALPGIAMPVTSLRQTPPCRCK